MKKGKKVRKLSNCLLATTTKAENKLKLNGRNKKVKGQDAR